MTYHLSKHETCIVMDGTCMYNCPTFFLFWKCLDDMSYWTNCTVQSPKMNFHFFTVLNLNYTVFVSLAHMPCMVNDIYPKYTGNVHAKTKLPKLRYSDPTIQLPLIFFNWKHYDNSSSRFLQCCQCEEMFETTLFP